jgi:hypothetical protein
MKALRTRWLALALCGLAIPALADENVTILLRNGERASGRFDGINQGRFFLDVSATDERHIPMGEIALVDLVGGAQGLPETELREARGSQHLLLLRSGTAAKGQLVTIEGSERDRANPKATTVVFRVDNGEERRVPLRDVARLYLGNFPGLATTAAATPAAQAPAPGLGVTRVPGNQKWVDTGLTVQRGQAVGFQSSGEVVLSGDSGDVAEVTGARSGRKAAGAPVPDVPAGALIGRIGSQPAFAIGNQTSIAMPGAGRLYLGVNDDENGDNQGHFDVRVSAGSTSRRRP